MRELKTAERMMEMEKKERAESRRDEIVSHAKHHTTSELAEWCGCEHTGGYTILKDIYDPDDILKIGTDSNDVEAKSVREWLEGNCLSQWFSDAPIKVCPNPIIDDKHEYRFAVVFMSGLVRRYELEPGEFVDPQIEFWSGIMELDLLDVSCIIDDGDGGLFAWIKVDCPDRETWVRDVVRGLFGKWLEPMRCSFLCHDITTPIPGNGSKVSVVYLE